MTVSAAMLIVVCTLVVPTTGSTAGCEDARKVALERNPADMYVPKCTERGTYQRRQCEDEARDDCWCVDEVTGKRNNNYGRACDIEPVPCTTARKDALKVRRVGGYVPKCAKDGTYLLRQCQGGVQDLCWCVDTFTGERSKMTGQKCDRERKPTECETIREHALTSKLVGAYIPACSGDGRYEARQCQSGTNNHCWCVDVVTGKKNGFTGEACDKEAEGDL